MEIQAYKMAFIELYRKYGVSVQVFSNCSATGWSGFFLSYYGVNTGDELSGKSSGEAKGGKTFWGTLALIQKTLNIGSNEELMWGDSWINYRMKMADMPYFSYSSDDKHKEPDAKEGSIDILKSKFGKYIKK